MFLIESYLDKIQQEKQLILEKNNIIKKIWEIVKQYGIEIKDLYIEPKPCKLMRTTKSKMYLLHGTKPTYVNSIKREGLKIEKFGERTKEEKDIMFGKPCIWFSSKASKKRPGFGGKGVLIFLVAKVDTKNINKATGCTYQYFKDVPPKDIVWENDKRFNQLTKSDPCLEWE